MSKTWGATAKMAWVMTGLVSAMACNQPGGGTAGGGAGGKGEGSPDLLGDLVKKLAEPSWEVVKSPLKDTTIIPQTGAATYSPEQALGMLWGLRAPASSSCKEAKVEAMELVPLGQFVNSDPAKCRLKNGGEHKVYTFRVDEKAAATLDVGAFVNAKADGERAFEIQVSHPAQVGFEDESACLPLDKILQLKIAPDQRFCSLRWARSVLLTTISWRSFTKVQGDAVGAYMIVKVGADLFSSTEEIKETAILSGNYADLVGRIPYDTVSGAINLGNPAAPPTPEEKVRTIALPQEAKVASVTEIPKETDRIFVKIRNDRDFKPAMPSLSALR